ncbi:MAG: hypothetical protein Kow00103_00850 [Candidatus Caldatribacteriota bacterium]
MITKDIYLRELEKRYRYYYEIEKNKEILGEIVDIFASSSIEHFRNILTKKIKIDKYYTKEYAIVRVKDALIDQEKIEKFTNFLKSVLNNLICPSTEVMSTTLSGVLITNIGFSEEAINFGQKFKFSRSFWLGIKGWCDIRLILIDLKEEKFYSNNKGKEILTAYKFNSSKGGDNNIR